MDRVGGLSGLRACGRAGYRKGMRWFREKLCVFHDIEPNILLPHAAGALKEERDLGCAMNGCAMNKIQSDVHPLRVSLSLTHTHTFSLSPCLARRCTPWHCHVPGRSSRPCGASLGGQGGGKKGDGALQNPVQDNRGNASTLCQAALRLDDDDVFHWFLQKQKIEAKLHIYL